MAIHPIELLLIQQRAHILQEWFSDILQFWSRLYPDLINEDELRQQNALLLDELTTVFTGFQAHTPPEITSESVLARVIRETSEHRAQLGFKPADTARHLLALKNVLTRTLMRESPDEAALSVAAVNEVLDRLLLINFDAFVETREKLIAQQSQSLIELSTPSIRIWERTLLLPLVGLIDTMRARQFTEDLLEAIARHEATVTIIDVTGVPIFDTAVARHLMKTVDAAQLLGTRIIMTGIRPETALTLTKLGLSFSGVTCRASLRAGMAEAFAMNGQRVILSEKRINP